MPPESIAEVNQEIINLWSEKEDELMELQNPLLCPELFEEIDENKDYILFVGLNPSSSKKVYGAAQQVNPNLTEQNLQWNGLENINRNLLVQTWRDIRNNYSYYDTIKKYHNYITENNPAVGFYHIDLYFYRDVNAYNFKNHLKIEQLFSFWTDQLEISRDLIKIINPLIIIVVNSRASDIMRAAGSVFNSNNENLELNKHIGCWFLNFNNQNFDNMGIKTIFTSLYNGHPDKHTKELLKLHIKNLLNI